MTEKTLERAIDIKKNIDRLRETKDELEYHQQLCWGNTSEVNSRTFLAEIRFDRNTRSVAVSPESLKLALDNEIKNTDEILNNYLTELHELN